jgi:hypothetical protein
MIGIFRLSVAHLSVIFLLTPTILFATSWELKGQGTPDVAVDHPSARFESATTIVIYWIPRIEPIIPVTRKTLEFTGCRFASTSVSMDAYLELFRIFDNDFYPSNKPLILDDMDLRLEINVMSGDRSIFSAFLAEEKQGKVFGLSDIGPFVTTSYTVSSIKRLLAKNTLFQKQNPDSIWCIKG